MVGAEVFETGTLDSPGENCRLGSFQSDWLTDYGDSVSTSHRHASCGYAWTEGEPLATVPITKKEGQT